MRHRVKQLFSLISTPKLTKNERILAKKFLPIFVILGLAIYSQFSGTAEPRQIQETTQQMQDTRNVRSVGLISYESSLFSSLLQGDYMKNPDQGGSEIKADSSATTEPENIAENIQSVEQSAEVATQNTAAAETIATNNNSETVPPSLPPRSDLVIGLIADAHAGQGHGFGALGSVAWTLGNYAAPNAIVDLGDLIESRKKGGYISKKDATADFKTAKYRISQYAAIYHVIGNHEVLSLGKDDIQSLTGRKNFYAVNVKGYNIIVLDTNYTSDGKSIDANHDDTFIYDGTLTDNQVNWLKGQLKNNSRNLIFSHHPLHELTNSGEVAGIVKKNKERVLLIANGHQHPKGIQISEFGGVRSYDIPSAYFQRSQAVIRLNGSRANVTNR